MIIAVKKLIISYKNANKQDNELTELNIFINTVQPIIEQCLDKKIELK